MLRVPSHSELRPAERFDREADTAPCVGCGLCCDGTLYDMVRAEPEEEARILDNGLRLTEQGGKRYFELPCKFSCGGECSIYDQRFTKCRAFRCKLLKAYQAGELSLVEARERVSTAMRLKSEVVSDEPTAALLAGRVALRQQGGNPEDRRRLILHMAALDYFLDLHFRNKNPQVIPEGKMAARI